MLSQTKLSEKWSKILSEQPETGMGFQDVFVHFKDGTIISGFVINGEILETLVSISESDISNIAVKEKKSSNA